MNDKMTMVMEGNEEGQDDNDNDDDDDDIVLFMARPLPSPTSITHNNRVVVDTQPFDFSTSSSINNNSNNDCNNNINNNNIINNNIINKTINSYSPPSSPSSPNYSVATPPSFRSNYKCIFASPTDYSNRSSQNTDYSPPISSDNSL